MQHVVGTRENDCPTGNVSPAISSIAPKNLQNPEWQFEGEADVPYGDPETWTRQTKQLGYEDPMLRVWNWGNVYGYARMIGRELIR